MNLCHVTFVSTVLPVKNISVLKVYVHHCECFYCFYHWIIVTVFNWKVFVSYQYFKCWIFFWPYCHRHPLPMKKTLVYFSVVENMLSTQLKLSFI